jgi:hypothetical protein
LLQEAVPRRFFPVEPKTYAPQSPSFNVDGHVRVVHGERPLAAEVNLEGDGVLEELLIARVGGGWTSARPWAT